MNTASEYAVGVGIIGTVFLVTLLALLTKKSYRDRAASWFAQGDGWRIWLVPIAFLALNFTLTNMIGVWQPERFLSLISYFVIPTAIVYVAGRRSGKLGWLELLLVLLLWIPVELRWIFKGWKVGGISYPFVAYSATIYCLIVFTAWRKIDFELDWTLKKKDLLLANNLALGLTALLAPIGLSIGFMSLGINPDAIQYWYATPLVLFLFLFSPALPEELLFRGVIQNVLMERLKRPWLALVITALVFGFAHINNTVRVNSLGLVWSFPNWVYVCFASVAGLAYGWLYYKTKSLTVVVILHAVVDFTWWLIFKGGK